jgi:hypothetical protein
LTYLNGLTTLQNLNLFFFQITKSGFVDGEFGIANLRNLKELIISDCPNFTDECLKSAIEMLQLKKGYFKLCHAVKKNNLATDPHFIRLKNERNLNDFKFLSFFIFEKGKSLLVSNFI